MESFNPRSHEGSDFVKSGMYCEIAEVSIHAPTKGATSRCNLRHITDRCFNPRSHEGSDRVGDALDLMEFDVSIHAPTKGATLGIVIFAIL